MSNITIRKQSGDKPALAAPESSWDPWRQMRALLSWDPFREMAPYQAFEERAVAFAPAFDIKETKDSYLFKADVPGIQRVHANAVRSATVASHDVIRSQDCGHLFGGEKHSLPHALGRRRKVNLRCDDFDRLVPRKQSTDPGESHGGLHARCPHEQRTKHRSRKRTRAMLCAGRQVVRGGACGESRPSRLPYGSTHAQIAPMHALERRIRCDVWWASWHRRRHKYADTPSDPHSPRVYDFWYAHMDWISDPKNDRDRSLEPRRLLDPLVRRSRAALVALRPASDRR
jgi:hypothetical protein